MAATESGKPPRLFSEWQVRWILTLYPPWLMQGIRVLQMGPGFRNCTVRVRRSLLTKNLNGTRFGGTIYAAFDPVYAVMYWQIFARMGQRVQVWVKAATIEFHRPAATALTLEFRLTDDDISRAQEALEREGKFVAIHSTDAIDRDGSVCATAETVVVIRSRHTPTSES